MKKLNLSSVISILIVLIFIASSCNTTKKMALSCPDPGGNYTSKALNHPRNNKKQFGDYRLKNKGKHSFAKYAAKSSKGQKKAVDTDGAKDYPKISPISLKSESIIAINESEYKSNLYAALDKSITPIELEYNYASASNGIAADFGNDESIYERVSVIPINSSLSSEKDLVAHSFNLPNTLSISPLGNVQQEGTLTVKQTEGLGLAGMIVSLAGLLVLPIPCGIVGIVLSAISLGRFKKNPDKYKGKGFAIAGLAVGVVVLVLGIAILAAAV